MAADGLRQLVRVISDLSNRSAVGAQVRATRAEVLDVLQEVLQTSPLGFADADPQVRADASEGLRRLSAKLADRGVTDASELAHRHALRDDIERFLARPDQPRTQPKPPEVPPGPPIGD